VKISHQHSIGFQGLSQEGDLSQLANQAFATIATHQPADSQGRSARPDELGGDTVFILRKSREFDAELNVHAELPERLPQCFFYPPLWCDQRLQEWRIGSRRSLFILD
jgi:hypothetical protein